jgi:serine/threonine-protein kinase
MAEQPPPDPTADPLDAGLAAAFGPDSGPPLPAGGGVVQALAAHLPSAPPVRLREPHPGPPAPAGGPGPAGPPEGPPGPAGRYRLEGEIARGGMGAILRGRDTELGREVAVKVLLETHRGRTELVQRFVEEAQIAGQLQHPGVPPVYELGQFGDRRPYFAMKLVRGQTLAALLAARRDVAEDRPRFVGIFEQVCQTLAYAHARGVIHRDLKPANVMVGSFGEVQVMDWGLAKVLHPGGLAEEAEGPPAQGAGVTDTGGSDAAARERVGSATQAGAVLGTPAYMAPEQARGEVGRVDERADVFGLGALLCEILTGRPPFTGQGAEAQRQAQQGQLADACARLDGCGADTELIALAKRCLAPEPRERPRDAGAVAAAVTAYQAGVQERLRRAELERAAAGAKAAAERRARRALVGLAAALLCLVAGAGAAGLWYQRHLAEQERQRAEQERAVNADLDQVAGWLGDGKWAEARAALERAEGRVAGGGPADLRRRVRQMRDDLDLVAALDRIRSQGAAVPVEMIHGADLCRLLERYAAAARFYGDAFAAEPKLADDLKAGHRYDAACSAARAGCGEGEDAAGLKEAERARLRRQAHAWLRADLAAWARRLEGGPAQDRPAVVAKLRHWQGDGDLAGLRDRAALAKLPAEEREAWQKLWAEVEALLKKWERS